MIKIFDLALKTVDLFTDGACSGNPGPGGYGAILKYKDKELVLKQGYRETTNNRMELMALIAGLSKLKEPCNVNIYSDSKYVIDSIEKGWVYSWQAKNWMRTKTEKAQNPDLWQELLGLLEKHNFKLIWVKGHAGHPENERCDKLAVSAYKGEQLVDDIRKDV